MITSSLTAVIDYGLLSYVPQHSLREWRIIRSCGRTFAYDGALPSAFIVFPHAILLQEMLLDLQNKT